VAALRNITSGGASPVAGGERERTRALPEPSPASTPAPTPAPGALTSRVSGWALLVHSVLLSGVAGYVDAAGFVLLLGVFPAHLTGELVNDAIALSAGQLAARAARLWVFPVFMASIVVATLVARWLRRSGRKALTGLLALVTLSLTLFSASGVLARLLHVQHLPLFFSGACAVAAMGFQTALMRESLTGSCPTTVMTGNLAQVITELVDHALSFALSWPTHGTLSRSRFALVSSAFSAFTICAVLGAGLTRACGSLSVLVPTLVTAALTVRAWHEERVRPAAVPDILTELPWFDEDELWPDSEAPRALSQPYTQPGSVTRLKVAEKVTKEVG
jgi:uncharacterized membrane protein YoaK (UPF0700 family)